MYTGESVKTPYDYTRAWGISKDERTCNPRFGYVTNVLAATQIEDRGKDFVVNELNGASPNVDATLYNLADNDTHAITANTADTITTTNAHGLNNDDMYFIGLNNAEPTVQAMPYIIDDFSVRYKENRGAELPINEITRYGTREMPNVEGTFSGRVRSEDLLCSWWGALCGWWDWSLGDMHIYSDENYDNVLYAGHYNTAAGVDTLTNITTAMNDRSIPYITSVLLPANATTDDYLYICGADIFSSACVDITIAGIGANVTYVWEYWDRQASAWTALTNYIIYNDTATTIPFDHTGVSRIVFQPPLTWGKNYTQNPDALTQFTRYGYPIRMRVVTNTYTTQPVSNYIKLGYIIPTFTVRNCLQRSSPKENIAIFGMHPTKISWKYESGKGLAVDCSWQAKDVTKAHTIDTVTLPVKTLLWPTRHYICGRDITVTWTSSALTTGIDVESATFTIDTKGEGQAKIDGDNGISTFIKNVLDGQLEVTVPKRNSDFWNLLKSDPNVAANQVDIEIEHSKSQRLVSTLAADPAATDFYVTIAVASSVKLREGQVISLRQGGKIYYNVVVNVDTGAGTVLLIDPAGIDPTTGTSYDFTTAAELWLEDYFYVKFNNCMVSDQDINRKSGDFPFKENVTFIPLGDGSTYPIEMRCRPASVV